MSRNFFPSKLLSVAVFLFFGFSGLFVQIAQAADALNYFKNYYVTGDVAAAGVGGLRGTGVNGLATGTINMTGVPCTSPVTPGGPPVIYEPCSTLGAVP